MDEQKIQQLRSFLPATGVGAGALFLFTAAAHLACACFALWRISRRAAPRPDERDVFVAANAAARTTTMATALDPRAADEPRVGLVRRGEPARELGQPGVELEAVQGRRDREFSEPVPDPRQ